MKDTFDSLISEIRKSKDYYESTHPGASVDKILGTGSTLKIPGLRKFITQQIGVEVERLDEFKRIQLDGDQAADFAANAMGLVVAYGLALQGVGLGAINVNLVPMAVRRERAWMAKGKWFAAAAGLGLVISGMLFIRPITGRSGLGSSPPASVESTISQGKAFKAQFDELSGAGANGGAAQNMLSLVDYRNVWPHLVNDVYTALAAANPQPALLGGNVDEIKAIPVAERRLVTLDELGSAYVVPGADGKRRIRVSMKVSLSHADPGVFLNKEKSVAGWLRANADRADVPYVIVADSIKIPDDWTEIEFGKGARQKPDAPAGGAASGGSDFGAPASGDAASNASQGQGNKGMQGRRKPPAGGGQMPGMGQGLGLSGGGEGAGDGSGDGSTGGAGGADWSSGSDAASKSRRKTGGAATGAEAESIKVLEEARIGEAPSIYQPDDVYFVGEVTFEVELRDSKGAPAAAPAEGTQ